MRIDARVLLAGQWRQVIPAAGAALAYGTASALGGSGFIAAFVAGMTFRLVLRRDPDNLNQLSEQVGNLLNGVTGSSSRLAVEYPRWASRTLARVMVVDAHHELEAKRLNDREPVSPLRSSKTHPAIFGLLAYIPETQEPHDLQGFREIAGAGFEPATFGL